MTGVQAGLLKHEERLCLSLYGSGLIMTNCGRLSD